ncbi:MAG: N,N-dimethylformamidase beta subunit family domain-containing protein [Nocardioidaceae bacterium]
MHRAKVRCPGDTPPGLRHGRQESAQVETARGDVPDVGVDGSGERGRGAGQLWHPRVSGRPRWQASARVAARRSFEAATRTGSSPGSGRIHRLNGRAARLNGPFLGANTMYWRIRLAGLTSRGPRTLVGYRTDAALDPARTSEPSQATGLWRDSSRFPRTRSPACSTSASPSTHRIGWSARAGGGSQDPA